MLKQQNMTQQEIVEWILSGRDNDIDKSVSEGCRYSREQLEAVNQYIDYIVGELTDPDLAYNTETGFFDYVGPVLPA